jgi:hypothetical protein
MKNIFRSVLLAAAAALLLASAGVPSGATAQVARPSAFDGNWSVVIYTLRGDCTQSVRAALRIAGGRVYALDQSFQAYGAVGPSGAIRVTVAAGNQSASGTGRLSQTTGRGLWRTATGECSGQWAAERRNW